MRNRELSPGCFPIVTRKTRLPNAILPFMTEPDWGLGSYELTDHELLPVARLVVDEADPRPTERVLDIGSGTGNAALLAAERGAEVTGVDPARRLVGLATERAAARGLPATFVVGAADALPVDDAVADVILSVFGLIYASDAQAAAAEIGRVASPGGRAVLTAWVPEGGFAEAMQLRAAAIAAATGEAGSGPRFAWHDEPALAELFSRHGFRVETSTEELAFRAGSPEEFLDRELREHPLWLNARAVLEPRGELEALRAAALAVIRGANEDPDAFRVTSRYVVAALWR
jgi:ubiquinone/menaquinone biosynthesis C-methylase UbiE